MNVSSKKANYHKIINIQPIGLSLSTHAKVSLRGIDNYPTKTMFTFNGCPSMPQRRLLGSCGMDKATSPDIVLRLLCCIEQGHHRATVWKVGKTLGVQRVIIRGSLHPIFLRRGRMATINAYRQGCWQVVGHLNQTKVFSVSVLFYLYVLFDAFDWQKPF